MGALKLDPIEKYLKKQHNFETYPTTHFFSNGTLICAKEGKLEATELTALIGQHFSQLG